MNLTRLGRGGIQREHAYTAAKTHSHMEELHIQLTVFNIVPQRLFRIVLNGVVCLAASWSPACLAMDAAHHPTEFAPDRAPWIAERRSQSDDSDRRQCRNLRQRPRGKRALRVRLYRSVRPLPASPVKNVCDSCLRKRPYGRENEFRTWRNDGKKERTA